MVKNYIKIALRNVRKNKLYSAINIIGLSLGLAACLLIALYVQNELSYDKFHEKADRIVRVTMEFKMADDINKVAVTGTKVGPEFQRRFPSIEEHVRTFISSSNVKYGTQVFSEDDILFSDSSLFKIFDFDLIQGDKERVLDAPNKIAMSRSMAKKYFGDDNPLGKVLKVAEKDMIVSGVFADVPKNSQIKFSFVTQFNNLGSWVREEQYWSANHITYLLLNDPNSIKPLETQINEYMATPEVKQETRVEGENYLKYHLEPLVDVHLKSELAGFEPNGSLTYIYIFVAIALLILLIASANYTNLATAQSFSRSQEIGMRKVMGASKKQIFLQFISESTLITFIAAILALILSLIAIPYFNEIAGRNFRTSELLSPSLLLSLGVFVILVGLMSGFYPALVLAGSRVMGVLKKGFTPAGGHSLVRKSLIVGQFAISVFLIIYTFVILKQINYIQTKNLGYDKEHVLVLPMSGNMRQNFEVHKQAFKEVPGVLSVTASYETPEFVEWGDGVNVTNEDGVQKISVKAMPVDLDLVETLNMQLVAGRDFVESDFALLDTTNQGANYRQPYIINETLAQKIGWTPEEAIGKSIEKGVSGPILGVVKDFNFSSLHEPIGPLLIFLGRDFSRLYMLKINSADVPATLARLENVWSERVGDRPFNYHFLDEDFDALYKDEQRTAKLFSVSAGLAIVLACLGLFGLAAFSTVRRTKEIGIRKTLGASLGDIVMLLGKNFLILVSIAILIAAPLALWAARNWLQNFSYRIEPGANVFIIAALSTLVITFLTVGYHSLKAARSNPVKSLRTE